MYARNFLLLVMVNILCVGLLCFPNEDGTYTNTSVGQIGVAVQSQSVVSYVEMEIIHSSKRIISVDEITKSYALDVTSTDIENLMKIVEAEAGGEDLYGKILVADVVINRVNDKSFPNTVTEVIYQRDEHVTQFSPVLNGAIDKVVISEDTITAVYMALNGTDISKGALYFMARKYSEPQSVLWFDTNLQFLFTHGNHDFYS